MTPPQQRQPDIPKKFPRTVSMTRAMIDAISERAVLEGHRNWSAVVVAAVRKYLGQDTPKEAPDADRAA